MPGSGGEGFRSTISAFLYRKLKLFGPHRICSLELPMLYEWFDGFESFVFVRVMLLELKPCDLVFHRQIKFRRLLLKLRKGSAAFS